VTFKERKKIIKEFLNSKNNIKRKEEMSLQFSIYLPIQVILYR